ncbi:MAG: acyltransferase family protein [Pseudomonadota bacterium]|nr:acyltransferase family protein [Pseudomonadota bacterium]
MSGASPQAYRPEIDGLRAIAVISVVLYHFGVPLQGGFTGVDVFFVISGFLIGGILWREHRDTGRIRLVAFYIRRFRRLAPAFFTMLFATFALGWFILLPFEYREFAKSAIAATVYLSNVLFFRSAGYFDTVSEEKPLLHTWSLAVEEQFYIVLPLLFIALAWARKSFLLTLGIVWIGSLIACIVLTPNHPTATFFLFPFRAWELLSGVLLAIYVAEWRTSIELPASVSILGLICLIASFALIPAGEKFPGYLAVLPVFGTVLLLLNGTSNNVVNGTLSRAIPVFFGKISYSLYLWHWPILVLALYLRGEFGGPIEIAAWLLVCLVIATLSWRFVELPVRKSQSISGRMIFGGTVVASGLALAISAGVFKQNGITTRFTETAQTHIGATTDFLQDWSRCEVQADGPFKGLELCPIGPEGAPKLLVWGDSHVRALREGLDLASQEANTPGVIIWRAGCPPLFGLEKLENSATPSQNSACGEANRQLEAALSQMPSLESILLVGRWTYYWSGTGVGLDLQNEIKVMASADPNQPQTEALHEAAKTTVERLMSSGKKVFVFEQPPEVAGYDSRLAARHHALSTVPFSNTKTIDTDMNLSDVADRQDGFNGVWTALEADAKIKIIRSWDQFCDDATCFAIHDGIGQYFDNNHLTNSAALRIRNVFEPIFESNAQ